MKKIALIVVLLLSTIMTQAQTSIGLSAYKEIGMTGGKWNSWPSNWTTYASEGRENPILEIMMLEPTLGLYNLKYYVDGNLEADFHVVYDAEKTSKIRADWKDKNVNCYSDEDGDYIYLQGTSLKILADDSKSWANENTKMYMWMPNDKQAIVVK